MQAWMICHKDTWSIDFGQRKWTMLYGSRVGSLIYSMVYKPLGKFEPYMFWSQGFISLEWKTLNGIQWFKEGLIWALARLFNKIWVDYEHDEWLDHFSFILSWWDIILCCEKHSPRYIILDKAGPVKEPKDQGNVRPIKRIRVGWRMVDYRWAIDTFLANLDSGL